MTGAVDMPTFGPIAELRELGYSVELNTPATQAVN
jgi:hypothetical protein